MFNKRGANIPNIQIRYLGELIRVVDAIKYLGLNFSGNKKLSPNVENLVLAAERARFAVQNRINNIAGLSPELKIRLGHLLIRPVASFGCQIWGVNFLDIKKGVDNNELEKVHVRFLRHILGIGKNIASDNLRAEASSPAYHTHWIPLIFRLWNTLKTNTRAMAHDIWKANKLMLNGCHDCWSYNNNNNKRPLTPKSMPPAGDEHRETYE